MSRYQEQRRARLFPTPESSLPPGLYQAVSGYLTKRYPLAFPPAPAAPQVLSTTARQNIEQDGPHPFSSEEIASYLRVYCSSIAYLTAAVRSTHRCGLDGMPIEPMTPDHLQFAEARLRIALRQADGSQTGQVLAAAEAQPSRTLRLKNPPSPAQLASLVAAKQGTTILVPLRRRPLRSRG